MINKLVSFSMLVLFNAMLINCGGKQSTQESVSQDETSEQEPVSSLSLTEVSSPEFPDASMEMTEPLGETNYSEGEIEFQFNVKNYPLGVQTSDAATKGSANSANGQHIHLIINGEPYLALYEPSHTAELESGNHVVLSFLSRSYHESIKHYGAYVLRQFSIGETDEEPIDATQPLLFYSRPKGEYQGADTEKVLLDFYLVNTDLSSDGNKVRATINGEEFILDKWAPYFIEGLPAGENRIKLELIDMNGNLIDGPYNSVERTINLVNPAS
jgi:hypothetical protein